ncbi:hypothetical protein, partial [Psychroflexus maritimus]
MSNITFAQPTTIPFELSAQYNGQYDYKILGNTHNEFDNNSNPPPPCEMLTQSSAVLELENNQNIVLAYLYWSGVGNGLFDPEIQLNGETIFADIINVVDPQQFGSFFYYGSFKDITQLVQEDGSGTYIFSGLDLNPIIGADCSGGTQFSGWSIFVIYEDNTLPIQQVNVYNGFASVYGFGLNSSATIEVGSLNVVDTQDARMGFLAWNGSPNLFFNESISFNGNLLSNPPLNPVDNPFNGTNSYTGATDLWNMDLDFFDISNYIEEGDTSANITFTSGFNRYIQNVVTVIRSELPDATVELINFSGIADCDERDFTIETQVGNFNASDILPANTPISFFVLDENDEEVFLETFFTQAEIAIDESETQFFTISIPDEIPENTTLIAKVNTLADGSNPINESNILNNDFEQELFLPISPEPLTTQNLTQCANLSESFFNLEEALENAEDTEDEISFHLSQEDAEEGENPIENPADYNPTELIESLFVRRFDDNCFAVSEFEIESLIPPQINEPELFSECDFSEEQLGFTEFDLTSKIDEITG